MFWRQWLEPHQIRKTLSINICGCVSPSPNSSRVHTAPTQELRHALWHPPPLSSSQYHPPNQLTGVPNLILLPGGLAVWRGSQINTADIGEFTTSHMDICPTFCDSHPQKNTDRPGSKSEGPFREIIKPVIVKAVISPLRPVGFN